MLSSRPTAMLFFFSRHGEKPSNSRVCKTKYTYTDMPFAPLPHNGCARGVFVIFRENFVCFLLTKIYWFIYIRIQFLARWCGCLRVAMSLYGEPSVLKTHRTTQSLFYVMCVTISPYLSGHLNTTGRSQHITYRKPIEESYITRSYSRWHISFREPIVVSCNCDGAVFRPPSSHTLSCFLDRVSALRFWRPSPPLPHIVCSTPPDYRPPPLFGIFPKSFRFDPYDFVGKNSRLFRFVSFPQCSISLKSNKTPWTTSTFTVLEGHTRKHF